MRSNNAYYWDGKKKRAETAVRHTEEMFRKFNEEITECVSNTKVYSGAFCEPEKTINKDNVTMRIFEGDSVSALMALDEAGKKTAVLNYASYKHPGGGFVVGSRAQEESLCHESFLYNVLKEFDGTYYEENRSDLNKGLYRDRALYSPDIVFLREINGNSKEVKCDVVTCASPNFSVAEKFVSRGVNNTCLRNRVRFILEIAKKEKVDRFIVGSWGCGVFKQDPRAVAKCFEEESQKVFGDAKIELVFAVIPTLPNQTDNFTPFVKMVEKWNS